MVKIGILGYGNLGKGVELAMKQNPDMELVAYARAAYRLSNEKQIGARTVLDIPISMLSIKTREELLKQIM